MVLNNAEFSLVFKNAVKSDLKVGVVFPSCQLPNVTLQGGNQLICNTAIQPKGNSVVWRLLQI